MNTITKSKTGEAGDYHVKQLLKAMREQHGGEWFHVTNDTTGKSAFCQEMKAA